MQISWHIDVDSGLTPPTENSAFNTIKLTFFTFQIRKQGQLTHKKSLASNYRKIDIVKAKCLAYHKTLCSDFLVQIARSKVRHKLGNLHQFIVFPEVLNLMIKWKGKTFRILPKMKWKKSSHNFKTPPHGKWICLSIWEKLYTYLLFIYLIVSHWITDNHKSYKQLIY